MIIGAFILGFYFFALNEFSPEMILGLRLDMPI